MTSAALLAELETLPHRGRFARMVAVGRQSRTDARLRDALAELATSGWYERLMSLVACHGSGDAEVAARFLGDPSRRLRARAARLVVLLADDTGVAAALARMDAEGRRKSLMRLRSRKRFAAIDAFLARLEADGDTEFLPFLPFASADFVLPRLADALDRGTATFRTRLARYHPSLALAAAVEAVKAADRASARLTETVRVTLLLAAEKLPVAALALADAARKILPGHAVPWATLAKASPQAVAALLLKAGPGLVADGFANTIAHRADHPTLLKLIAKKLVTLAGVGYGYWNRPARSWLSRIDPERRESVYLACRAAAAVEATPEVLALLPTAARLRLAREELARPAVAAEAMKQAPFAGLLPYAEAVPAVTPLLKHPDADRRSAALSALGSAVRFDRARLGDYLALVKARKFEQDPVRQVMLTALAAVPLPAWAEPHLDAFDGVFRDALDASDLSYGSSSQLATLAVRLWPRFPDRATRWITTLLKERGRVESWGDLSSRISPADAPRHAPKIAPLLAAWKKTERNMAGLSLASALGRRLEAFPALIDFVVAVARESKSAGEVQSALSLLRKRTPERFADLVPKLLRDDASYFVVAEVSGHLHRSRQDLLTPYLQARPLRGKFSTGKTIFVPGFADGFDRWTAAQQALLAGLHRRVLADVAKAAATYEFFGAINVLSRLPAVPPDDVVRLAGDMSRPAVQTVATQALGRLDGGQGVGILIEALGDDRARVAIYALRRALRGMPASHAMDLLRGAPMKQVTVAKEVVRLIGDTPGEAEFQLLLELSRTKLHIDVRGALLRALWPHLNRPEAWAVVGEAVATGEPALLHSVIRAPDDGLTLMDREFLVATLAAILGTHDNAEVRIAVLDRLRTSPPDVKAHPLFSALGQCLPKAQQRERNAAAAALWAVATPSDAARVAKLVRGLLADRRAVVAICTYFPATEQARLGPVARAVVKAMSSDPHLAALAARLTLLTQPADKVATMLSSPLREDVRDEVLRELREGGLLRNDKRRAIEDALSRSPSPSARRLALAALEGQADDGWTAEMLERLRAFRADPAAEVAAPAGLILPDEEE